MKKINIHTSLEVATDPKELQDADRTLLKLAKSALGHSYSPYSNFKVAAGIRLKNGVLLSGSNQENASYPLCLCAERVAIAAADAQYPGVPIVAMAITVKNPLKVIQSPAFPCGACRQVICETEQKHQQEIRLILQGETGDIYIASSGLSILPFSFDISFLKG